MVGIFEVMVFVSKSDPKFYDGHMFNTLTKYDYDIRIVHSFQSFTAQPYLSQTYDIILERESFLSFLEKMPLVNESSSFRVHCFQEVATTPLHFTSITHHSLNLLQGIIRLGIPYLQRP